jgi:nitronate monooxygenase
MDRDGPLLERLGVERPVVQAGMGGGISRHELAAAVSEAGGLGTIAAGSARMIAAEVAAARRLTSRPIAVNILLPFARRDWWPEAALADVVVTFWGKPKRRVVRTWVHQCGSVEEALAARAAGADGVIVQGVEAGGHVRGTTPALELLEQARAALGPGYPVWLAGGVATREDVETALAAGAEAAVAGTRFLLTPESRAHGTYRDRVLAADRTILTTLFGAGWPSAPHRVVPNAATERWLGSGDTPPRGVRLLHSVTGRGSRYLPESLLRRMFAAQRPGRPMLSPLTLTDDAPAALADAAPLYAGESVLRIDATRPAAEVVAALSPAT